MAFSWATLQALYDLPRRYQRAAPAGGSVDVTVLVVGIAMTVSIGTVTVTGSALVQPTGVSAVAAIGSPAITGSALVQPSGVSATSAVGAPTVSGSALVLPSGVEALAAIGAPAVTGDANVPVVGLDAVAALGDPVVKGDANVSAVGLEAAAALGDPVVHGDANVAVLGLAVVSAVGAAAVTGDANVSATLPAIVSAAGSPTVWTLSRGLMWPKWLFQPEPRRDRERARPTVVQRMDQVVSVRGLTARAEIGAVKVCTTMSCAVTVNPLPPVVSSVGAVRVHATDEGLALWMLGWTDNIEDEAA